MTQIGESREEEQVDEKKFCFFLKGAKKCRYAVVVGVFDPRVIYSTSTAEELSNFTVATRETRGKSV